MISIARLGGALASATLAFALAASAQTPQVKTAGAADADAHKRIDALMTATSLDRPGMHPWHLRIKFSLYSLEHKQQEEGVVEEWWQSPTEHKVTITSPSLNLSTASTAGLSPEQKREAYLANELLRGLVHPVSPLLSDKKLTMTDAPIAFANVKLQCLSFFHPEKDQMGDPIFRPGPKFCTAPDSNVLRMSFDDGSRTTVRNRLGNFLNTQVALDQAIAYDGHPAITGSVDKLETFDPAQAPISADPVAQLPTEVPAVVIADTATVTYPADLPPAAFANRVGGTVVVLMEINPQGKVTEATVIATPSPTLSGAAVNSTRLWVFKPVAINGTPVNAESILAVNFAIPSRER